ncbi:phosphotransferase family protein [Nocardioides humi]|uniref:phosphotransferase family protein n=1 Tax=Nocardioides humi TaxID=449461 RepID=UPI0015E839AC|nr:phosphotransferase family protein [Nocardioides humi]
MSILNPHARDLAVVREPLRRWIERQDPALGRVEILSLTANTGGSGQSNDTFFATVAHDGGQLDLVVRCGPADVSRALFLDYDIPKQFRLMRALAEHSDVPVAPVRWFSEDPTLFGGPFYVMDFVAGDIPSDFPPCLTTPLIADATEEQQGRMWWSTVETIAKIGCTDWRRAGLQWLAPTGGRSPLEHDIDSYERLLWSGRVGSPAWPEAEEAAAWLRAHRPADEPVGLLWGDVRMPNLVFRDHWVAAVLDWEMAGLGNPEADLVTFLVYQYNVERQIDPVHSRPRPPGFGSDDETVATYEELVGRSVRHFDFYWVFATYRYLAIAQRYYMWAIDSGAMSRDEAEHRKVTGGERVRSMMQVVHKEGGRRR